MFVDIWGWFNDYEREANASGDAQKQRMFAATYEAWDYRRLGDGENAIRAFEEALKIAKRLNEPNWVAFHQFWIAVIRLYVQSDYQAALEIAVKLVTELRKKQYQACPIKGSAVFLLAKVYFHLDFRAYESEILGLLDYLEKEQGMDEDTYLQLLAMTAEIDINHKHYTSAQEKLHYMLSQCTNMPYRLHEAYRLLRRIAFIQGDIALALENNIIAQKHAQAMMVQSTIADEKLWEAVLLKYTGDDTKARERYYQALAHYEQYKLVHGFEYCTANADYLELDKQVDAALKALEDLFPLVKDKPSILHHIDAYCAYIALLGRSGRDFSEPLAQAKAIAQTSLKPEPYLERLNYIEAGNYFDYDWQKTSRKAR